MQQEGPAESPFASLGGTFVIEFRSVSAVCVCVLAAIAVFAPSSMAGLTAPSPYLSFADSPFAGGTYQYFYLEDFEDGALNTPGVSVNGGLVLGPDPVYRDSVDGDNGPIDGSGTSGYSYYSGNLYSLEFAFNQGALGSLPTCAGLVWTDVGFSDKGLGYDTVTFEAFDAGNASLGSVTLDVGDGDFKGQTAEDRFFGVTNAAGISKIVLTSHFSTDWEMDHLQYGAQQVVPVPGALLLAAFGTALIGIRRRRA
jgi:hypothetical protein